MRNNTIVLLILSTFIIGSTSCYNSLSNRVLIINNKLTSSHVRFKGTKTFLIPPKDYKWDRIYSQYITSNLEYIRVIEIEGKKFDPKAFDQMSVDSLREIILERHEITIQSYKGVLLFSSKQNDSIFNNGILVFGDSSFTTMISARYIKNTENEKLKIEKMLKSVFYDYNLKIYPLEGASYNIDLSSTKFIFSNTVTNTYTYTTNSKDNVYLNTDIPRIDIIQYGKLKNVNEIQHLMNAILSSYIYNGFEVNSLKSNSYTVGGIDYYESIMYAENEKKNNVIYILLLNGKEFTLIFHGMSYTDHEKYLEIFKTTSKTLEFK